MPSNREKALQGAKIVVQRGYSPMFMLGLLFLTLKLVGVLPWSWLWVTSPFWLSIALPLVFMAGALTMIVPIALITAAITVYTERRHK